jgi:hypothetical protein
MARSAIVVISKVPPFGLALLVLRHDMAEI